MGSLAPDPDPRSALRVSEKFDAICFERIFNKFEVSFGSNLKTIFCLYAI